MTSSSSQDERLNVAGVYLPKADMAWFDRNYESAGVHEMMHRGLQKLAEAGLISKQQAASESLVRGLMLKHFGDVELSGTGGPGDKQIEWARQNVSPRELDQLENVAAKYRAQLQPRGPR